MKARRYKNANGHKYRNSRREHLCHLDVTAEAFQDSYAATFSDLEAWAESFADDTGMLSEVSENIRRYFDFVAWPRDAELSGNIWTIDTEDGVAVFWSR